MAQLSNFVAALKEGGVRANQFEVSITKAPMALDAANFTFLCKATSVPAMAIGEIAVPYRGKQIYVAGERTYDTWAITVFSDRDLSMRNSFELWQSHLHDIGQTTGRDDIGEQPSKYYGEALVKQLDRNDNVLRVYKLHNIWPTSVDAMEFGFDTNDAIMEFGVTFRYNYMTIDGFGPSSGQFGTP